MNRPPNVHPFAIHPAIEVHTFRLPLWRRIVDAAWLALVIVAGH